MLTTEVVVAALRGFAATLTEQRQYLIDLDSAIGDADHGENMARGMTAAIEQLDAEPPDSPTAAFKSVAMTLMRKVGGAAGPLYGTAFLRASTAVTGRSELSADDVLAVLRAASAGIVERGKANPGDKTMVDAWLPAVRAAEEARLADGDSVEVLQAAAEGAEQGAEETIPLVARKGRASYLGERSAGHQDPGATSTAMLLRAFAEAARSGRAGG
jgi:phosphoenolpyruvate---glycerone phosphotransferase subunit DhaL